MKIAIPMRFAVCGLSLLAGFGLPEVVLAAAPSNAEKSPAAPPAKAQARVDAQIKAQAQANSKAKSKTGAKAPVKAAASATSPLVVTLSSDRKTYKRGQLVSFVITARNPGKTKQTLSFTSGQSFDLSARAKIWKGDAASLPRWDWSYNRYFTQVMRESVLAPNASRSWKATWRQTDNQGNQLPRGTYLVEARVTANKKPGIRGIEAQPIAITLTD